MPDASAGNSGPAGYAVVKDGKFSTYDAKAKGSISGAVNVLITGYDPEGGASAQPLFEDHPETANIDPSQKVTQLDFKIEKSNAKKR